jgi:hypothetical protein
MKYALVVIIILALVVFASGCTDSTKTYSGNGISFNYSGSWQQLQQVSSPNAIVAFGDNKTADQSTGNVNTLVVVQKVAMPAGATLKQVYDSTYQQFAQQDSSFKTISDTTTTVDGTTAYVNTHTVNVDGVQKQEKAAWLEKNGNIYVILYGALPSAFNNQQANFDTIINTFKVNSSNSNQLPFNITNLKVTSNGNYDYPISGTLTPTKDISYIEMVTIWYDSSGAVIYRNPIAWNMNDLKSGQKYKFKTNDFIYQKGTPTKVELLVFDSTFGGGEDSRAIYRTTLQV